MAIKDIGASVLARIKLQSKESGINYQTCLQLFVQEEFLRRLEMSKYSENFILKGGMFLYTLTNFAGRPTMDVDFLIRSLSNDISDMGKVIDEICSSETGNDYIVFSVVGTKEITPEKEYPGVGVNLLAKIKNVRIPFSIDIGVDDVVFPSAIRRKIMTRLKEFAEPTVLTYTLESILAEKFDAIVKRMTATSRMKDFYDIYFVSNMYDFEGEKLHKAVAHTLAHRGTKIDGTTLEKLSKFSENEFLCQLWNNYNPGPGLYKPKFDDVIERISLFMKPIYDAIISGNDVLCNWKSETCEWIE